MDATHSGLCPRATVRAILYVNFFLFALLVIPATHHWVDRGFFALRSANLEEVFGGLMQVWIVASTLVATMSFALLFWKNRRAGSTVSSIRFDAMLLLTWWILLVGVSAYSFVLGTGG
jgi:hypothetical protein